jgi:hypothetical protein
VPPTGDAGTASGAGGILRVISYSATGDFEFLNFKILKRLYRRRKLGAPGEIRTPDPLIRSQPLKSTELRAQLTTRPWRSGGDAPAGLSHVNAGALAADFEQRHWAQADVFAGQKLNADRLESAPDRPGDSRRGRPPLRLEIVDRTRADRSSRCEFCDGPAKQGACRTALGGGLIALGRADRVRSRVILITASVSRHRHKKSRPDKASSPILPGTHKDVVRSPYKTSDPNPPALLSPVR